MRDSLAQKEAYQSCDLSVSFCFRLLLNLIRGVQWSTSMLRTGLFQLTDHPLPTLASSLPGTWYDLTLLMQECEALQGSGSETLMLPGTRHRGPCRGSLPGTASQREVHLCSFGRSPVTYLKPQTPMTNQLPTQPRPRSAPKKC